MIIVRMVALQGTEPTREFRVASVDVDSSNGHVTMKFRDGGGLVIQAAGAWRMEFQEAFGLRPHTTDEAERIHNGSALVSVN